MAGQVIQPSQHNPPLEDLASGGLSLVLVRDGRAPMTGNLNMNTAFKITNLLAGSNALDAVNKTQLDAASAAAAIRAAASEPGYLYGVTLANNGVDPTNDIDIAAGAAASDGSTPAIMSLASVLTKRLDASWAVGSGSGGLDTGSIANTTYHVWLIQRSDTGVVDALFSASATAPTMPANYDRKRRIGSIMRVSAAIVPFIQTGDTFVRAVRIQDISVTNPGTSAVTRTLSVPTGINVFPFGTIQIELTTASAVTVSCLLTDLAQPDSDPGTVGGSVTLSTLTAGGSQRALSYFGTIKTNTSAQIRSRFNISGSATNFVLHTEGWVDTRGRI